MISAAPTAPVSSRHETHDDARHDPVTCCAADGCTTPLTRTGHGRPARYCSPACRSAAHRALRRHRDQPIRVEIDHGSTSAKGRTGGRVWLVRLRRADRAAILATGLDGPPPNTSPARSPTSSTPNPAPRRAGLPTPRPAEGSPVTPRRWLGIFTRHWFVSSDTGRGPGPRAGTQSGGLYHPRLPQHLIHHLHRRVVESIHPPGHVPRLLHDRECEPGPRVAVAEAVGHDRLSGRPMSVVE